jgi:hypothetical protein
MVKPNLRTLDLLSVFKEVPSDASISTATGGRRRTIRGAPVGVAERLVLIAIGLVERDVVRFSRHL